MAALRIPITNVYGGGDYTAQIRIGSLGAPANVILDTGSSTLAVVAKAYGANADPSMKATALAQDVIYGTGGWTGPVITTTIAVGSGEQIVSVDTYLAITDDQEPGNFGTADGILGLAFNSLNSAYNLATFLTQQDIEPPVTYPWPFRIRNSSAAIQQFGTFLARMREEDLPPYFTALESQGISKNIFAFYTLRSAVAMRTQDPATDALNNGVFILGGGPEQSDLYTGDFVSVDVVDDMWYNTNLLAVQVAGCDQISAKPLPPQYAKTSVSNSIVDSGTNSLVLASDVYSAIISSLTELNAGFAQAVQQSTQAQQIPASNLNLADWPDITFVLEGENGQPTSLTCAPSTYWQVDAPAAGQAMFQIYNSGGVQSILGLPLLNNYYTVFDRTQDPYGAIRFAPIATSS
jgi:hypothetical protein